MPRELHREWASGTPDGTLLTRGLLVHLARRYAEAGLTRPVAPRENGFGQEKTMQEATVAAAVRLLDEHFAEPLRVEQVAASVFLSPDRFTEVFARTVGCTPRDYLRHLRVECAKSLLRTTPHSISEIGMQAGFNDPAYFTRVFRAATGKSPREYRRGG